MTTTERPDVVVIGAGIAGLVAANTALDHGASVHVLDPHPPGGRARTTDRDGRLLNLGPHAVYRGGVLQRLLDQWRLDLPGGDPADLTGYGLRAGRLEPLPVGARSLLRTGLLRGRSRLRVARLVGSLPRRDPVPWTGRSVAEWTGDEPDDVRALLHALIRTATYCDAPERLDAGAAVAQLQLALAGVRYVDGGWGRVVEALVARLAGRGVTVGTGEVRSVSSDRGHVSVVTGDGEMTARTAIVAAGGPRTEHRLLGGGVPDTAPAVEATVLDLLLDRAAPRTAVFGIDVPLYASAHSAVARLAPDGAGLVSTMHYLAPGEPPGPPAEERAHLRELAGRAGVDPSSVTGERFLHRVTVAHSFPDVAHGGLLGRPGVATGTPGVFRAGDWVGADGMLADASAASGAAAAQAAAHRCATIPA